jgi:hypothetical protein
VEFLNFSLGLAERFGWVFWDIDYARDLELELPWILDLSLDRSEVSLDRSEVSLDRM